jgi:hypothetical protein
MIVLYQNELYDLDMPFALFESFKSMSKKMPVEIIEKTQSSYKMKKEVFISDLEDYSVARNRAALSLP